MRRTAIISAVRTPVGKAKGCLAPVSAEKLGTMVVKEAVRRGGVDPDVIDEVIYGNLYAHDISNMARFVTLAAGIPETVPGITIDRRCGTSLTAISLADALIRAGDADCVLAGGVESDSRRPYVLLQQDELYSVKPPVFRSISRLIPEEMDNLNMGMTAERLAQIYKITRQECDMFSVESHRRAASAWEKGYFEEQVIPVKVDIGKKGSYMVSRDEAVRADCNSETLSKLRPSFCSDGIVTAGNSSPMSDGASAVLLMEETRARELGLEILGYISGFTSVGCDPHIMGIGPVPATQKLLKKTGLTLSDIDLIEMNEAFASQSLACIRELGFAEDKLNVNGGAIALGHPLAASGGILVTKLVYEMRRRDVHRGLVTFCCGGGQGVALLIER